MDFQSYQQKTHDTAIYPDDRLTALLYLVMGLASEAGEVLSLAKKHLRDNTELSVEDMEKELGDILWYHAEICTLLGLDMEDVAMTNIAKLQSRKLRNTLQGSGDNR